MSEYNPQQVETLISSNMGLVVSLAKSLRPSNNTELDEYIQSGTIGLWKAIKKHDPTRSKLSTLAWDYIRWEIIRYINKNKRYQQTIKNPEIVYTRQLINESRAKNCEPSLNLLEILPNNLSESERVVVDMRNQGYTFKEIGQELGGFTKGWANTLFKQAVTKIQNANKETHINGE